MKGRFVPPSLSVVKCCFLYVPTLTELSRSRLNECIYSQIPTETDGGGWSGISVPLRVQCTVVAAQYGDRSLHVCRSVDNCASLHGTLSHMAVFELTGTAGTLNRSSGNLPKWASWETQEDVSIDPQSHDNLEPELCNTGSSWWVLDHRRRRPSDPGASSMKTLLDLYLNLLYNLNTSDPETSNPFKLVVISPDIMQQNLGFGRWTELDPKERNLTFFGRRHHSVNTGCSVGW